VSISTEWFFYLVYPFACIVLARLRRPGPIILITAIVVVVGYASVYWVAAHQVEIDNYGVKHYGPIAGPGSGDDFQGWLLYLSPYPHLFEFALGCLAAALLVALRDRPVTRRESLLGRCGLVLAIGGIAYRSWVSAALSRPWMVLCGEASYSIYLIHIGVVQYASAFDEFAGLNKLPYTLWSLQRVVVELVLVTAIVIGLSLISYNVIEVPARRWLRRWLSLPVRRTAAVVPAHAAVVPRSVSD
jgi:peptidoglycan/LPS O-acetylase OafA/YrhL